MVCAVLLAMLIAGCVTPAVSRLAVKLKVVDHPGGRRLHDRITPRWGGIAIYAGVITAIVLGVTYRNFVVHGHHVWNWQIAGILVAATIIAIAGMLDDIYDLSAGKQIVAILTAGIVLIAFGVRIDGISNPLMLGHFHPYNPKRWIALGYWSIPVTLLWIFVVTKTVDAIDGLDGLAAGVSAISAATMALMAARADQPTVALIAAAVVGGCIGFLWHNYNPARIFMGTVGAQFLGFVLASLAIVGTFKMAAAVSVFVPILVLGVPLFDYAAVLVRRFASHAPLHQADRRHLHYRLLDYGLSQRQVVLVMYSVSAILCVAAFLLFRSSH